MKEKVKIWSRRRLLGAFLAFLGLAAVANAQNGTRKSNCGSELAIVTKTANQLNDDNGTPITLNFTGMVNAGDEYFFVADHGGGALSSIICNGNIGKNIEIIDDGYTNGDYIDLSTPTVDDISVPSRAAGVFTATEGIINPITITLKYNDYNDGNSGIASDNTTLYLGVFVKDASTGCYSDVNWIRIETELNIYAALTLRNAGTVETPNYVPNEYICNGGTTATNLGFTLCNLPANGTLKYKVKATSSQVSESYIISGQSLNASAGTVAESGTLANTGVATNVITKSIARGTDAAHTALVEIGNQTLINANAAVAGTMVFSFVEMTYTYTGDIGGGVQGDITLPIVFETEQSHCNPSINATYPTEFTVHVAPNFKVQALAYAEGTRPEDNAITFVADDATTPNAAVPTFCQGLDAYLHTAYSTTEGFITSYTWSQVTPSDPVQQLTITNTTDRAPVTSDLTQLAYQLKVATLWNDATTNGNYGLGCPAEDVIDITVTEAPRLLVQATNSTFTHDGDVCPGTPINISAQDGPLAGGHTITAENILSTGNGIIIDHNNANFSYTIETSGTDLKVFDTWRATQVTEGNLPVLNDFFDNEDNVDPAGDGTITYIIRTIKTGEEGVGTNVCPLVNLDGTALTETTTVGGNTTTTVTNAVKLIYTVSPRPQFQLGAN